jgi:hypothetical protein
VAPVLVVLPGTPIGPVGPVAPYKGNVTEAEGPFPQLLRGVIEKVALLNTPGI